MGWGGGRLWPFEENEEQAERAKRRLSPETTSTVLAPNGCYGVLLSGVPCLIQSPILT